MTRILEFPKRLNAKAVERNVDFLTAKFLLATEGLKETLDLLDLMQAKIDQMCRMLPENQVSPYEHQQSTIVDEINRIRAEVASISALFKNKHEG